MLDEGQNCRKDCWMIRDPGISRTLKDHDVMEGTRASLSRPLQPAEMSKVVYRNVIAPDSSVKRDDLNVLLVLLGEVDGGLADHLLLGSLGLFERLDIFLVVRAITLDVRFSLDTLHEQSISFLDFKRAQDVYLRTCQKSLYSSSDFGI